MIGIIIFTLTAFIMGLLLVFISEKFKVESNEKKYEELLPGYNCGVCGYNTCAGMAKEMANDPSVYTKCKPLRGEALNEMEAFLRGNNLI